MELLIRRVFAGACSEVRPGAVRPRAANSAPRRPVSVPAPGYAVCTTTAPHFAASYPRLDADELNLGYPDAAHRGPVGGLGLGPLSALRVIPRSSDSI